MTISLIHGCCQIETSARDLGEVRGYMTDVLGAGPIEQELAEEIDQIVPDPGYGCDHIGLGEAVFQVNQPAAGVQYNGQKSVHQTYLERVGPSVTNLNFFVDDIFHAKSLLSGMGAPIHIEGPSSAARALSDYGPENTRPGVDKRPFLFMGTRHLIGLDLEIMEPNFLRFSEQAVQYPAFVHPRPQAGDGNLLLERLRIVVSDLEKIWENLATIFNPGSRGKPFAYQAGAKGKSFRIGLGGIEIEYCQPASSVGALAEALDQYGPGVLTIEFSARDLDAAVERARGNVAIGDEPDWLGTGDNPHRILLVSRDPIGFDTVLEARAASPLRMVG